jgi:hypothetical protein
VTSPALGLHLASREDLREKRTLTPARKPVTFEASENAMVCSF